MRMILFQFFSPIIGMPVMVTPSEVPDFENGTTRFEGNYLAILLSSASSISEKSCSYELGSSFLQWHL
jgi:hypothetical protein